MVPFSMIFIGLLLISSVVFQIILYRSIWLKAYIEVNIKNKLIAKIFRLFLVILIILSIFFTFMYLLILILAMSLS